MKNIIIREAPYLVLKVVSENPGISISKISFHARKTFSFIYHVVNQLEEAGLLRSDRVSRRARKVYLTDKGKQVYKYLSMALSIMNN